MYNGGAMSSTMSISGLKRDFNPAYLVWASLVLFLAALTYALFDLGGRFGQPLFFRLLVAAAVPVATLGHAIAAWYPSSKSRLVHGAAFAGWMLIAVALAAFYVLDGSEFLRARAESFVRELFQLGQTLYSALFGIGIFVSLTAMTVERAMRAAPQDNARQTLADAMPQLAILLAMVTSAVHLWDFGSRVALSDLFSTLSATIMADAAFLAVKFNIQAQLEARRRTGGYDMFDLVAWSVFGVVIAVYLIAINGAAVLSRSAPDIEAFRREGVVPFLITFYGMSPSVLLLGLAAMRVLTGVVDYRHGKREERQEIARQILSGGEDRSFR